MGIFHQCADRHIELGAHILLHPRHQIFPRWKSGVNGCHRDLFPCPRHGGTTSHARQRRTGRLVRLAFDCHTGDHCGRIHSSLRDPGAPRTKSLCTTSSFCGLELPLGIVHRVPDVLQFIWRDHPCATIHGNGARMDRGNDGYLDGSTRTRISLRDHPSTESMV